MSRKTKLALGIGAAVIVVVVSAVFVNGAMRGESTRCLELPTGDGSTREQIERHIKATKPALHIENLYYDIPDRKNGRSGETVYAGRLSDGMIGVWSTWFDYQTLERSLYAENAWAQAASGDFPSKPEYNTKIMNYPETQRVIACARNAP